MTNEIRWTISALPRLLRVRWCSCVSDVAATERKQKLREPMMMNARQSKASWMNQAQSEAWMNCLCWWILRPNVPNLLWRHVRLSSTWYFGENWIFAIESFLGSCFASKIRNTCFVHRLENCTISFALMGEVFRYYLRIINLFISLDLVELIAHYF